MIIFIMRMIPTMMMIVKMLIMRDEELRLNPNDYWSNLNMSHETV